MKCKFTKMQGAGNDYIYVYTPQSPVPDPAKASREWSRSHFGIGSDGLILIGKSRTPEADFTMRMFNSDGTEGTMCGNGIRCVAKYVYDHRLTDKKQVVIDTLSGIKVIEVHTDENDLVTSATVDMGVPQLKDKRLMDTPDGGLVHGRVDKWDGTFVSMGNPHFVIFVPDSTEICLENDGRQMETNPVFPRRCNIEFATVRPDGSIRMRVWERGSGVTLACGTGACATAVAACVNNLCGRECTIEMDGGTLHTLWREDNGHLMMTGPAVTVFEGEIDLP